MPRPHRCRRIQGAPDVTIFKPAGVPARLLEEIVLALDELEAMRLADLEGLYHADAAARMGISRATFGRVVASARRKVAEALVMGCSLRIEGGPVIDERLACAGCGGFTVRPGAGRCLSCGPQERPPEPARHDAPPAKTPQS